MSGLTDGASKLTDSYRYSGFGEEISKTGRSSNPFGYVENRAEPAAGLSDFRARAYDPSTGRFTSEDPVRGSVAEAQTMNPYAYARNAPLAYTDPDGRLAFAVPVVAVVAVVAAPVVIGGAVGCAISEVNCTGAIGDIISPDPALESEAVPTPEPPAPEPELQPAPGDEVLPSPESGMGADQKIPPASAATSSETNGEDSNKFRPEDVKFDPRQVQKKYDKHKRDWGFEANHNPAIGANWVSYLQAFPKDSRIEQIVGTYRGTVPVIHWVNRYSRLYFQTDRSGNFVTAFRLNEAQLRNVLGRGSL